MSSPNPIDQYLQSIQGQANPPPPSGDFGNSIDAYLQSLASKSSAPPQIAVPTPDVAPAPTRHTFYGGNNVPTINMGAQPISNPVAPTNPAAPPQQDFISSLNPLAHNQYPTTLGQELAKADTPIANAANDINAFTDKMATLINPAYQGHGEGNWTTNLLAPGLAVAQGIGGEINKAISGPSTPDMVTAAPIGQALRGLPAIGLAEMGAEQLPGVGDYLRTTPTRDVPVLGAPVRAAEAAIGALGVMGNVIAKPLAGFEMLGVQQAFKELTGQSTPELDQAYNKLINAVGRGSLAETEQTLRAKFGQEETRVPAAAAVFQGLSDPTTYLDVFKLAPNIRGIQEAQRTLQATADVSKIGEAVKELNPLERAVLSTVAKPMTIEEGAKVTDQALGLASKAELNPARRLVTPFTTSPTAKLNNVLTRVADNVITRMSDEVMPVADKFKWMDLVKQAAQDETRMTPALKEFMGEHGIVDSLDNRRVVRAALGFDSTKIANEYQHAQDLIATLETSARAPFAADLAAPITEGAGKLSKEAGYRNAFQRSIDQWKEGKLDLNELKQNIDQLVGHRLSTDFIEHSANTLAKASGVTPPNSVTKLVGKMRAYEGLMYLSTNIGALTNNITGDVGRLVMHGVTPRDLGAFYERIGYKPEQEIGQLVKKAIGDTTDAARTAYGASLPQKVQNIPGLKQVNELFNRSQQWGREVAWANSYERFMTNNFKYGNHFPELPQAIQEDIVARGGPKELKRVIANLEHARNLKEAQAAFGNTNSWQAYRDEIAAAKSEVMTAAHGAPVTITPEQAQEAHAIQDQVKIKSVMDNAAAKEAQGLDPVTAFQQARKEETVAELEARRGDLVNQWNTANNAKGAQARQNADALMNEIDAVERRLNELKAQGTTNAIALGGDTNRPNLPVGDSTGTPLGTAPTEAVAPSEAALKTIPELRTPVNDYLRADIAGMQPAEKDAVIQQLRDKILVDKTGIGSAAAYANAPRKAFQVHSDVDSLKWVNDNLSHEAGDALLKAKADLLRAEGIDAYHISGDEFISQFDTQAEAEAAMQRVADQLKQAQIEVTLNGQTAIYQGAGFSYGIGAGDTAAEDALKLNKDARFAAGERAARGEQPRGLAQVPASGVGNAQGGNVAGNLAQAPAQELGTLPLPAEFAKTQMANDWADMTDAQREFAIGVHRATLTDLASGNPFPAGVDTYLSGQSAGLQEIPQRGVLPEPPKTFADVTTAAKDKGIATVTSAGKPLDRHLMNVLNKHAAENGVAPFANMADVRARSEEAFKVLDAYMPSQDAPQAVQDAVKELKQQIDPDALKRQEAEWLKQRRINPPSGGDMANVNPNPKVIPPPAGAERARRLDELSKLSRGEYPTQLSQNVADAATEYKFQLTNGTNGRPISYYNQEQGGRVFMKEGTTNAPFYRRLLDKYTTDSGKPLMNRQNVEAALNKIIKDKGLDKGVNVERVKQEILQELAQGLETSAGKMPPDWEARHLLGYKQSQIDEAYNLWAEAQNAAPETSNVGTQAAAQFGDVTKPAQQQGQMFTQAQDSPLFSGTPVNAKESAFLPQARAGEQGKMFSTAPEFKGAKKVTMETPPTNIKDQILQYLQGKDKAELVGIQKDLGYSRVKFGSGPENPINKALAELRDEGKIEQIGGKIGQFGEPSFRVSSGRTAADIPAGEVLTPEETQRRIQAIFEEAKKNGALSAVDPKISKAWNDAQVNHTLDAIEQAKAGEAVKPPMPPNLQALAQDYITKQYMPALTNAKLGANSAGRWGIESTVLNYDNRYNVDDTLNFAAPFTYWWLHSLLNYTKDFIEHPALLAYYVKLRQMMDKASEGMPDKYKHRVEMTMPFGMQLPNGLGNSLWVNPLQGIMPVDQVYNLSNMERASYQSVKEDGSVDYNSAFSDMFGIHQPYKMAYWLATGQTDELKNMIASLPAARVLRGLTQGITPGGVGIDGKYDVFYYEKAMKELVADGTLTDEQAKVALLQQSGKDWNTIKTRAGMENYGVREVSGALGMRGYAFTPGEQKYLDAQKQKEQIQQDAVKQLGGNPNMSSEQRYNFLSGKGFYSTPTWLDFKKQFPETDTASFINQAYTHPNDASGLSSVRMPQDQAQEARARSYYLSKISDAYWNAPELRQKLIANDLGPQFQTLFRNKDTRNLDAIPLKTVLGWANALDQMLAKPIAQTDMPNPDPFKVTYTTPDQNARYQKFYDNVEQSIGWSNLHTVETGYFNLTDKKQRAAYLTQHPELKAEWDTEAKFYKDNPDLLKVAEQAGFKKPSNAQAPSADPRGAALNQAVLAAGLNWDAIDAMKAEHDKLPVGTGARTAYLAAHPDLLRYYNLAAAIYGNTAPTSYGSSGGTRTVYRTAQPARMPRVNNYNTYTPHLHIDYSTLVSLSSYYKDINQANGKVPFNYSRRIRAVN